MDAVRSANSRKFAIILRVIIYLVYRMYKESLDDAVKHHVDIKGRFVRDEFAKSSCCDSCL